MSATRITAHSLGCWLVALLLPGAYLFVSACTGALIAYSIYIFSQAPASEGLVVRCSQLVLVFGLLPLVWGIDLKARELGLIRSKISGQVKAAFVGFFVGTLIIAPLLLLYFLLEIRSFHLPAGQGWVQVLEKLPPLVVIALLVAFFEELVFRGVLLAWLIRCVGHLGAVGISAFYFAGLHFFHGERAAMTLLTPVDGLRVVVNAFILWPGRVQWDTFASLMAVGVLLAMVRLRFVGLNICIGIHAAWIVLAKLTRMVSDLAPDSRLLYLVGRFDGVNGILSAVWLSACTMMMFAFWRRLT